MRTEYRKLKAILKNSLRINASKADLQKNLVDDPGLCEWEVAYLIAKVENEFNVDLPYTTNPHTLTVGSLLLHVQQGR